MQPGYDPRTALIVVDVQNDFRRPGRQPLRRGRATRSCRTSTGRSPRRARPARWVRLTPRNWHPPSTPHFARDGGRWPVHCVAGTWGAAFYPSLDAGAGPSVRKGVGREDRLLRLSRSATRAATRWRPRISPGSSSRAASVASSVWRAGDRLLRPGHRAGRAGPGYPTKRPRGGRASRGPAARRRRGGALRELAEAGCGAWCSRRSRRPSRRLVERLGRVLLLGASGLGRGPWRRNAGSAR